MSSNGRLALLRLLPRVSVPLTVAAAAMVGLGALLPSTFALATGSVVGRVPAAVDGGFASPAGRGLIAAVALLGVLYVVQYAVTTARATVTMLLRQRVDDHVSERVMRSVLQPTGVGHLENPELLDKLGVARSVHTGRTPGGAAEALVDVWSTWAGGVACGLLLATYHWTLAALMLAVRGTVAVWSRRRYFRGAKVREARTRVFRRSDYLGNIMMTPAAAKEARVFGMKDWVVARYEAAWLDALAPVWADRRKDTIAAFLSAGLLFAGNLVSALVIGRAAARGDLSIGSLAVLVQALGGMGALGGVSSAMLTIEQGTSALPALAELESDLASPRLQFRGSQTADGRPRESIRFESVSFQYDGRERGVFDGLDLEIPAGRSLAIVGENGAGKTTLVKLLARLYEPGSGRISVDGIDLRDIDPPAWQRRIAAIFQDFIHYALPARDNVGLGGIERMADEGLLQRAVDRAGAGPVIAGLPHGWDTVLNRTFANGAQISGGQWQRIALARALFAVEAGAGVLVLDEPTANLDVRGEAELFDRFLDMTRGLTAVIISHRFSTVRRADRIVVLERGRVAEQGTHDELVARGGRYAEMFMLQAARFAEQDEASR